MGLYVPLCRKTQLPNASDNPEIYLKEIQKNCDATACGIGKTGEIGFAFIREAESASEASFSAQKDVLKAIPGASLIK